ncbi:MAG: 4-hydroxy-3-methylbut-2-enyl diphosphate reductase [Spirochaetaceae bacterium]|nr:MAG: 4-hydroxy-3-methylbut-2-enyl diphosphate reductase [Spirochaetaceae bacterium]
MTRVIVDRNAGFCGGVRRAIRGTEELLSARSQEADRPRRILSYGQLVHNREVTDDLAAQGLEKLKSLEDAAREDAVVLRTHGISPQEEQLIRSRGADIHDLTCPRVKKLHRQIQEKRDTGYRIIIVGDAEHPEVRASLGHAGEKGMVVTSAAEVRRVPTGEKIAVFAQTTITPQSFQEVVALLESRGQEMIVVDSLCPFVLKRQRWIEKYSKLADACLILGGRNSSNTRKLHSLAAANGPAFHLSTAQELDVREILRYPVVALTAGASTSDHTIEAVLTRLQAAGALIEQR